MRKKTGAQALTAKHTKDTFVEPSGQDTKHLHAAIAGFRDEKPWETMDSAQLMQLRCAGYPITHAVVMGNQGLPHGYNVHIGADGLTALLEMTENADPKGSGPDPTHSSECLSVVMGNREQIHREEQQRLRQLGITYRGRGNWPNTFRLTRGHAPWRLDQDETTYLTIALAAATDTVHKIRHGRLNPAPWMGRENVLAKVKRKDDWLDVWAPLQPQRSQVPVPAPAVPKTPGLRLTVSLRPLPETKREKNELRPRQYNTLIVADTGTLAIRAAEEIQHVGSNTEKTAAVTSILNRLGELPEEITAVEPALARALRPLAAAAGMTLTLDPSSPLALTAQPNRH